MINIIIGKVKDDFLYEMFYDTKGFFKNIWVSSINEERMLQSINDIKELPKWNLLSASDSWILHGETISDISDLSIEDAYLCPKSLLKTEQKCKYYAEKFKWSLILWPNTFQVRCMAFITSDNKIAENAKLILNKLGAYISDYQMEGSFSGMFRTTIFYDYGREGEFAWQVAEKETKAPIIICDKCEGISRVEKFILSKLECICEEFEMTWAPYYVSNLSFYRVNDYKLYNKLWERSNKEPCIVKYTICGNANIEKVKEAFLNKSSPIYSYDEFEKINYLAKLCGWVYLHSYGGGSDEYYSWFSSASSNTTDLVISQIESQNGFRGYF